MLKVSLWILLSVATVLAPAPTSTNSTTISPAEVEEIDEGEGEDERSFCSRCLKEGCRSLKCRSRCGCNLDFP